MRNTLRLSYIKNINYTFKDINISYSNSYRGLMVNKYASIKHRIDIIKEML